MTVIPKTGQALTWSKFPWSSCEDSIKNMHGSKTGDKHNTILHNFALFCLMIKMKNSPANGSAAVEAESMKRGRIQNMGIVILSITIGVTSGQKSLSCLIYVVSIRILDSHMNKYIFKSQL